MTVSEQVIEVINSLCEKFGVAVDWSNDNILPYLNSLVSKITSYEINTSIFWICFVSLITLAVFVFTLIFTKKAKNLEYPWDDDHPITWGAVFGIASTVAMIIVMLCVIPVQVLDIIECINFPEKTIYDLVYGMLRG